jgi:hypothetical protein
MEEMILCIYFPTIEKKIVFSPTVDHFTGLQLKGSYYHFREYQSEELALVAISNGVESRPAIFKTENRTVPILSLQIELDEGQVTKLEWENDCYDCDGYNCYDTTVNRDGIWPINENNCVSPYNYCNDTNSLCDT